MQKVTMPVDHACNVLMPEPAPVQDCQSVLSSQDRKVVFAGLEWLKVFVTELEQRKVQTHVWEYKDENIHLVKNLCGQLSRVQRAVDQGCYVGDICKMLDHVEDYLKTNLSHAIAGYEFSIFEKDLLKIRTAATHAPVRIRE
jgi:hypothetical protein